MSERTQVIVARTILGFWILAAFVGIALIVIDIVHHASDYWYTFGPVILMLVVGAVLWGLGWSFVWAINKIFPIESDKPDML